MRIALYPGSFDPVTNGHLDVLSHALGIADRVVVAIGVHPGKAPMFSFDERVEMLRDVAREILPADEQDRLQVVSFENLVIDAAVDHGATLLIRGLRDGDRGRGWGIRFEQIDPVDRGILRGALVGRPPPLPCRVVKRDYATTIADIWRQRLLETHPPFGSLATA